MTETNTEKREYYNVMVQVPRYRRTLLVMSGLIVGMCLLVIGIAVFSLSMNQKKLSPQAFAVEKARAKQVAMSQAALALFVIVSMQGIALVKAKTRIYTDIDGIEYVNIFNRTYIPWNDIKDVKTKLMGSAMEKCVIRGKNDRSISFNAFMLDSSLEHKVEKNGVFDPHGEQITYNIKRSRLYKEVMRMYNRHKTITHKEKEDEA